MCEIPEIVRRTLLPQLLELLHFKNDYFLLHCALLLILTTSKGINQIRGLIQVAKGYADNSRFEAAKQICEKISHPYIKSRMLKVIQLKEMLANFDETSRNFPKEVNVPAAIAVDLILTQLHDQVDNPEPFLMPSKIHPLAETYVKEVVTLYNDFKANMDDPATEKLELKRVIEQVVLIANNWRRDVS